MPDSESENCSGCETSFTLFNRKHHCRLCLGLFCHDCAGSYLNIWGPDTEAQRACGACATEWHTRGPSHGSTGGGTPQSRSRAWVEVDCMELNPNAPSKRYAVTVPTDIQRGAPFQCSLDGRIRTVILPINVQPGDNILVRAPLITSSAGSNSSGAAPAPRTRTRTGVGATKTCAACTFDNPSSNSTCAMCSSALPAATASRRGRERGGEDEEGLDHDEAEGGESEPLRVLELQPDEPFREYPVSVPPGVGPDDVFQVLLGGSAGERGLGDTEGDKGGGRAFSLLCPSWARTGTVLLVRAPRDSGGFEDGEGIAPVAHITLMQAPLVAVGVDDDENEDGKEGYEGYEDRLDFDCGGGTELAAFVALADAPPEVPPAAKAGEWHQHQHQHQHQQQEQEQEQEQQRDEYDSGAVGAALRDSLLLTKRFPLQHLHYTLHSASADQDQDKELRAEQQQFGYSSGAGAVQDHDQDLDQAPLEAFRASLVLDAAHTGHTDGGPGAGGSAALAARREQFLAHVAQPLAMAPALPPPAAQRPQSPASGAVAVAVAVGQEVRSKKTSPQPQPQPLSLSVKPQGNLCPRCTFENPRLGILCAVCDEPLPMSEAKTATSGAGVAAAAATGTGTGAGAGVSSSRRIPRGEVDGGGDLGLDDEDDDDDDDDNSDRGGIRRRFSASPSSRPSSSYSSSSGVGASGGTGTGSVRLALAQADPFLHCEVCTLENEPGRTHCIACESLLPVDQDGGGGGGHQSSSSTLVRARPVRASSSVSGSGSGAAQHVEVLDPGSLPLLQVTGTSSALRGGERK